MTTRRFVLLPFQAVVLILGCFYTIYLLKTSSFICKYEKREKEYYVGVYRVFVRFSIFAKHAYFYTWNMAYYISEDNVHLQQK